MLMRDSDPPKNGAPLSREELLHTLYEVWPAMKTAPHVWWPSASSCIYRTDTGDELQGVNGQRLYLFVTHAADIPRAGDLLFQRFWLAGHGRYDLSKSGAFLDRSLVDAAVWQPERLDFAGGAKCEPGLEQRRPEPVVFNPEAPFLDTSSLPDLSPDEQKQLAKLKAQAREAMDGAAASVRKEWIEERIEGLSAVEQEAKREILCSAIEHGRLLADFTLHHAKHGAVTVGELLDNPTRWHNARFADPLEPDYGNDARIAVVNLKAAGRPYIFSHAHGGRRFTLHRAKHRILIHGGDLPEITSELLRIAKTDGAVFDRDGELVRLAEGRAYPITPPWLVYYLTGLVCFQKYDNRGKRLQTVDCPERYANVIQAMVGQWKLPVLTGIVTAPTMTPDGRILETDGYDEHTGLYLDIPDPSIWPAIPECTTPEQAQEALRVLWYPFQKFPFETATDRGVFLSALLTAAVRALLPTAPGFLIDSPTAGTGKTFLAKCLSILVGGEPGVMPPNNDETELRKTLLALVRTCPRVILIDNVAGTLRSEALCSFLTDTHFSDRLLGASNTATGRTNALFVLTGNNVAVVGDLNRRLLRCRIDPKLEQPWKRTFDLNPLEYTTDHRPEMICAALRILKTCVKSGYRHDNGRLASFEVWDDLVRNAVAWLAANGADVADPVASIEDAFETDTDTLKLRALLQSWHNAFGSTGTTVAKAIRHAVDYVDGKRVIRDQELLDAFEAVAGERGRINPRLLAHWINYYKGRIVDGLYFARARKAKVIHWSVQEGSLGELGELWEFSIATDEKTKGKNNSGIFAGRPNTTPITPTTPSSCLHCVNFTANRLKPETGAGTCETPYDGKFAKLPDDGQDCTHFEQVTY